MAGFTRTAGDFEQVLGLDAASYTRGSINAITSAATVNPQGPKLDFVTITFTGTGTTGAQVKAALDTIQQKATIAVYEFTTVGVGKDTLAVALYNDDAWELTDAGDLDVAITAAVGEAVSMTASATFTN